MPFPYGSGPYGGFPYAGGANAVDPFTPTAQQVRVYNATRQICQGMNIPQVVLAHKKLKGTVSVPTSTGNVVYTGPGPVTNFNAEYQSLTNVWWVDQPFLRGEQRLEANEFGIQANQQLMSQLPALDDNQNLIQIEDDDFIIDGQTGRAQSFWRVVDVVWSPDYSYVTFMAERQR